MPAIVIDKEDLNILRPHATKSNTSWAICPSPGCGDTRGHCEVDNTKGLFHCHRCGQGGRIRGYVRRPSSASPVSREAFDFDQYRQHITTNCRAYRFLLERGFTTDQIRDLSPRTGNEAFRVYIPILDRDGAFVYVAGRSILANPLLRWWYPPTRPGKNKLLYGLHRVPERGRVVLVEGLFDAVWSSDRLAIFGTTMSDDQLQQVMALNPSEIVLFFDGDEAGEKATETIGVMIQRKYTVRVRVVRPPQGKDPHDLGPAGNRYLEERLS